MEISFLHEHSYAEVLEFFGARLAIAVLCGFAIGLERELRSKAAGIKTNLLICIGSTLYTAVSVVLSAQFVAEGYIADPARVAAQVVSGIGFIGAGTIIQSRGNIRGLTTAAMIWVVASLGVCIGLGYFVVSVLATAFIVLALISLTMLEARFLAGRTQVFSSEIVLKGDRHEGRRSVDRCLEENNVQMENIELRIEEEQEMFRVKIAYRCTPIEHNQLTLDFWTLPGVQQIKTR